MGAGTDDMMMWRGAGHLISASIVRALGQGTAVIGVAALLGASEWGKAAALLVVANMATQLTASGVYAAVFTEDRDTGRLRRPGWSDIACGSLLAAGTTVVAGLAVGLPRSLAATGGLTAIAMSLGAALLQGTWADALMAHRADLAARATVFRPLLTVVGAMALWAMHIRTAQGWLIIVGVASLVDCGLVARFRHRHRMPHLGFGRASALRAILWLGLGTAGTALLRTTDQLLLARWTDFAAVGTYALAARGVDVAIMVIAATLQSRHASLRSAASEDTLVAATRRLARVGGLLGCALAMPVAIGGFGLQHLLGDGYVELGWVVVVLVGSLPARAAFLVFEFSHLLRGGLMQRNIAVWSSVGANAVLNVLLIPLLGVMGAAVATLGSEVIVASLLGRRFTLGEVSIPRLARRRP